MLIQLEVKEHKKQLLKEFLLWQHISEQLIINYYKAI